MSRQILVLLSILSIVVVSCEDPIPEPLEFLYPPDTIYECNLTILDLDHDTLFREKFDVLEGNLGLANIEFSVEEGSTENRLTPLMFRQNDDENYFSKGEWEVVWQIKNFQLQEMGLFVQPYLQLQHNAENLYEYIFKHIDSINAGSHHIDLKFKYKDNMGIEYSNNHETGTQILDADERLNVEILALDTLEIHGLSNSTYFTEVDIEAIFDGFLYTSDNQDSIYITGYHHMPISGMQNQRYPE